jgi:hypothetical protein
MQWPPSSAGGGSDVEVGQRVMVQQPAVVSPVAMAPARSLSGIITGRYQGDYIVKLDIPAGVIEVAVVSEARLRPA